MAAFDNEKPILVQLCSLWQNAPKQLFRLYLLTWPFLNKKVSKVKLPNMEAAILCHSLQICTEAGASLI